MRRIRLAAFVWPALTLGGCAPSGPVPAIENVQVLNGGSEISRTKNFTTRQGTSVRAGFAYAENPDCSEIPSATGRVVSPPSGGEVTIERGLDFPEYPPGSPRENCNMKKGFGLVTTYRPRPDFVGADHFSFEIFLPGGKAYHNDVNVTVE